MTVQCAGALCSGNDFY
uniref:Uncharacterized protein n=1 Tax=Rhizophora mucronata TaxID=61149 RepID=A0A2P2QFU7_RHIMU